MRISVRQLRRIIKEGVTRIAFGALPDATPGVEGELGPETRSVLMSCRKAYPNERPLEDYDLEDMELAGVVHAPGFFKSPKASGADPNIAARWNMLNHVYMVPTNLMEEFRKTFPEAENAEDSFVKFVNQPPRAPNAIRSIGTRVRGTRLKSF